MRPKRCCDVTDRGTAVPTRLEQLGNGREHQLRSGGGHLGFFGRQPSVKVVFTIAVASVASVRVFGRLAFSRRVAVAPNPDGGGSGGSGGGSSLHLGHRLPFCGGGGGSGCGCGGGGGD
jgi:hypothetical protein